MRWVNAIVENLRPRFGGIPTFVEDPDHLLDLSEVRETLRASGMRIDDWDGLPAALIPLKQLGDDAMPLLIVGSAAQRHVVEACLTDFRWELVSVGNVMPKFAQEVVKAIPTSLWDDLLALHDETRLPRSPHETAILIGRACYGVDPQFLRQDAGWIRLLTHIAVADDPLPVPIARAILEVVTPRWPASALPETLSETANTRAALSAILAAEPILYERASRTEQLLLAELRPAYYNKPIRKVAPAPDMLGRWEQASRNPQDVLRFGQVYAQAVAHSTLPDAHRLDINRRFTAWLKQNYGLLLSTPNPAVLRLPSLLDTLNSEYQGKSLALFVVDALGLAAWERVKARWIADGLISKAETRAAFAVLPTITSLSRRALFEGKPPSQFSPDSHSQRLERKLWTNRFPGISDYFSVDEIIGFADSLAIGKPRLCVVDISWDKRGHAIDPIADSIAEAANIWAGRAPLRQMIKAALEAGYHVVLTADHGQVECVGMGRLNVGVLSEERSKRVMLFQDKTVRNHAMRDWTDNYTPAGLPPQLFPLFAADLDSFDLVDAVAVSHGGLTLDEVLVPVAEVWA